MSYVWSFYYLAAASEPLAFPLKWPPQVITVPGEGIVKVLAQVLHKDFGKVKVAFDTTLMCTALALSLIFFHRLNGLGTGTIISALIVGRIVYFYNHHLGISKAIGRFVPEHA